MTNLITQDPRETVAEHIETLRGYAARVLTNGGELTDEEMADKTVRFRELVALCDSFNVTKKEMVCLVLKQIMREPKRCGCPTCRARLELQRGNGPTGASQN